MWLRCTLRVHLLVHSPWGWDEYAEYLVNEDIEVCIIQINCWIILQQRHQEALYLTTLYVPCVVQVIYPKSNCMPKQTHHAWLVQPQ